MTTEMFVTAQTIARGRLLMMFGSLEAIECRKFKQDNESITFIFDVKVGFTLDVHKDVEVNIKFSDLM